MTDDSQSPNDQAIAALEDALDTIEQADDDPIAQAKAEVQAIEAFAINVAEAVKSGLTDGIKAQLCGSLADETGHTKTDIKGAIDDKLTTPDDAKDVGESINSFIDSKLAQLVAVRSTDAKQSTLYRWHFDTGCTRFEIETGEHAPTSHFNWKGLRAAILDVSGIWTLSPPDTIAEEWSEWVGPKVADADVTTHKGPRTCAVESLQNAIGRTVAFPTLDDAVLHNGIKIDADPEKGEPSELWIPNTTISKIAEDHAISERALQVELDAREHTVEHINGVSKTTFVGGEKHTFWVLKASFADPADYDPEPANMTDRYESLLDEDEQGDDGGVDPGPIGETVSVNTTPENLGEVEIEVDDGGED